MSGAQEPRRRADGTRLLGRDGLAGLLFVVWGIAGLILGRNYTFFAFGEIGAGYVPKIACAAMILLGAAILVADMIASMRGTRSVDVEEPDAYRPSLRPLLCVLGSVVAFSALIETAGLVPAGFAAVVIAAAGGTEFRWRETLMVAAALCAGISTIFIYALKLPIAAVAW